MYRVSSGLMGTLSKAHSMGTDLGSCEWLGHSAVRMGLYLAPLAMYWERWECPAQGKSPVITFSL